MNQKNLPVTEREKPVPILGMLGSDFDGERASAGILASGLLKTNNVTWSDVVCIPEYPLAPEPPPPPIMTRSDMIGVR